MQRGAKRTEAAVLVPVYRDAQGHVCVVLVVRAPGDMHGGQVAFPGGKRNAADRSLEETAIREAQEEIGLEPSSVDILEALPRIDTMTTGFIVSPFLASIQRPKEWRRSTRRISHPSCATTRSRGAQSRPRSDS